MSSEIRVVYLQHFTRIGGGGRWRWSRESVVHSRWANGGWCSTSGSRLGMWRWGCKLQHDPTKQALLSSQHCQGPCILRFQQLLAKTQTPRRHLLLQCCCHGHRLEPKYIHALRSSSSSNAVASLGGWASREPKYFGPMHVTYMSECLGDFNDSDECHGLDSLIHARRSWCLPVRIAALRQLRRELDRRVGVCPNNMLQVLTSAIGSWKGSPTIAHSGLMFAVPNDKSRVEVDCCQTSLVSWNYWFCEPFLWSKLSLYLDEA